MTKSVLDNVPRVCSICGKTNDEHVHAFPCGGAKVILSPQGGMGSVQGNPNANHLDIVGSCPICGSPLYGHKHISVDAVSAKVLHSCECQMTKNFVQTK